MHDNRCFQDATRVCTHAGVAAGKGVGRMAGHVISFESLHVLQPAEQTGAGSLSMRSLLSTWHGSVLTFSSPGSLVRELEPPPFCSFHSRCEPVGVQ